MGLFGIFKKKTTNVDFEKVKYNKNTTLENNFNGLVENPTWQQVNTYIDKMILNSEEFVILTLSRAVYGIRYIQACKVNNDGYSVELGIEKGNKTNLVEKICDRTEVINIFSAFYNYGFVEDIEKFKPVSFMV